MALTTEFKPLQLSQLRREAAVLKADGWRFIQTHAVNTDNGIDLYYSFMKDGHALNYWIQGVQKGTPVPSITDLFLAAFVFENEARELFGVDMRDIALDFGGALYAPAINEPMTIITPEQRAAREKARKAAAAAASSETTDAASLAPAAETAVQKAQGASGKHVFVMTPERQARLDAKLPLLSEEKRAKVAAALKARAAEAEAAAQGGGAQAAAPAQQAEPAAQAATPSEASASDATPLAGKPVDASLEQKLSAMDSNKAEKVRAALGLVTPAQASANATASPGSGEAASANAALDAQLESLISIMDAEKAATVRAALAAKGGE